MRSDVEASEVALCQLRGWVDPGPLVPVVTELVAGVVDDVDVANAVTIGKRALSGRRDLGEGLAWSRGVDLITDAGETELSPGMCAGFKAGTGDGHQLVNRTDADVVYLEVGDRTPGDEGFYPDDDLKAQLVDGAWRFTHKDGTSY